MENGWHQVMSIAQVGVEEAGPPGATFERLWLAIQRFEHSDPRIVIAHFDEEGPLQGRVTLLELRALGLRYLCPVRTSIGHVSDSGGRTIRGLSLDTLEGHIESGREWFFLEKDHTSGVMRFRIEAAWREGDFPNFWSHWGFHLVGRRYQRAWHRLAHSRLRRIAASFADTRERAPNFRKEPIWFHSRRGVRRSRINVEREEEDMQSEVWKVLGLGALSGVRSLSGPAAVVRSLPNAPGRLLSLLAAGELAADKLPSIPRRTSLLPLAARAASGAFVGYVATRERKRKVALALLSSAAAVAATFASYHLRRLADERSRALGTLAAVAEDALAMEVGSRLAESMPMRA